ncbi:DMT family transporter [Ramlibacter sp. WS9]|uniref:DMT family transporter n=1 Tax=Ramlibacter sp. WS9 TaxID=1882741 RepID=UPI0021058818|nr:DMT family transporter [Ramlibacter sp. WS9]
MLAAAASGVQVGAAIVASRFAVAEVPPLTLAMLRYAIGFACLLPFAWMSLSTAPGASRPPAVGTSRAADLLAMAALGIGQFGVLIALLNFGLRHVGAAQAALIFSLLPLLTLSLGAVLGRERVTAPLVLGVLLSIAGVALSLAPKLGQAQAAHWWGEAAVAGAACTGALCSVLYRPYLQRYPMVPVSAFAMASSVVVLAMLALGEQWPARVFTFSGQAWAATGFIGVSSGIGYFLWLYALKHESPTRVTVFLALNPLTAALLGWAWLNEPLQPVALYALGLIAAGLWLATLRPTAQELSGPRP